MPWLLVAALSISLLAGVAPLARTVTPSRLDVAWHSQITRPRLLEYAPRERSMPAVDPSRGWLFVADRFGKLRSFDSMGRWRWEVDVGGPVEAGLVVHDDKLYVATVRGRVLCLDVGSGKELWSYDGTAELATRPTVADGRVFVSSLADTLLALDAATGEFLWFHRRPRPEGLTIRGSAPAVVYDGKAITGFSDGTVVALDVDDGRVSWRASVGAGEHRDVNAAPVLHEGTVYVASYSGSLHAFEAAGGREIWVSETPRGTTRMSRAGDRLITAAPGLVSAHHVHNGATLWQTRIAPGSPSEISVLGNRACLGTEEGPLVVLNTEKGVPAYAFDPGTGTSAGALPDAQGLWLLSNGGWLYRLSWPAYR